MQCDGSCSAPAPNVPSNLGSGCNRNQCGGSGTIDCNGNCNSESPYVPSNYGQSCGCGGVIQCSGQCSASDCPSSYVCRNNVCLPQKEFLSTQTGTWQGQAFNGWWSSCGSDTFCLFGGTYPNCGGGGRVGFSRSFNCPSGTVENANFQCGLGGTPYPDNYRNPYQVSYSGGTVTVTCEKQQSWSCYGTNSMSGTFDCYKYN